MAKDVIIIPGDGDIQFNDGQSILSARLQLDDNNNLIVSNVQGDLILGTSSTNVIFGNILNSSSDTDKFLVSENGILKYRTGAQLRADIGAQVSGTYNTIIGTDTDINTSGATIIDSINVTDGVITSMGTRTLTPADIGAQVAGTYDNYVGWSLQTDNTDRGSITSSEIVNFVGGENVNLNYSATNNTITINSTDTNTDTNTTYSIKASTQTGGAGVDLDAGGSGSGTDTVKIVGTGATTVTRTDASTITISSVNTVPNNATINISAGSGLTTGGSFTTNQASGGTITLDLDLNELSTSTTNGDGDYFVVVDTGGVQRKLTKGNINLSEFNNNSGWTSNTGTVTSVGGTGTVNGITLTGTVTTSGNLTLGGSLSGITVAQLAGAAVITSTESFSNVDTALMTAAAIEDKILSYGYTTATGDITGVTAGNGLTGGGTSGGVTLNVGAGDGISVAADTVAVNSTVVRTSGNQTIGGTKTFSSSVNISASSGYLNFNGDGQKTIKTSLHDLIIDVGFGESTTAVIIDGTTAEAKLHVYGDYNGNNVSICAEFDIAAYSDASVKTNIRTIDSALNRVVNSRGVIYDRTDNEAKDNIGFIAQELEQQFPELVYTQSDGKKAVKYQNAVAVLFEAIKEQQTQIDEIKKLLDK